VSQEGTVIFLGAGEQEEGMATLGRQFTVGVYVFVNEDGCTRETRRVRVRGRGRRRGRRGGCNADKNPRGDSEWW